MKLVYSGGWHDVYCNGERHVRTRNERRFRINGQEWTKEQALANPMRTFKCDCSYWKEFNSMIGSEPV